VEVGKVAAVVALAIWAARATRVTGRREVLDCMVVGQATVVLAVMAETPCKQPTSHLERHRMSYQPPDTMG